MYGDADRNSHEFLFRFLENEEWIREKEDSVQIEHAVFRPLQLSEAIINNCIPRPDREYYIWRSIQRKYNCEPGATTTHIFHLISTVINEQLHQHIANLRVEPQEKQYKNISSIYKRQDERIVHSACCSVCKRTSSFPGQRFS